MAEITFKVKKPDKWDWLKDDYFKRFEKDDELRDRVSKLVYQHMRQRIKTSEEEEEPEERLEEKSEEESEGTEEDS